MKRILGIESSCDETAVAIVGREDGKVRLLAEQIASQIEMHARFGGIVPEVASRAHLEALPALVAATMAEAGVAWRDLDGIAVTAGPGLMGALLVGVSYARAAGLANNLPVIPVHHMEGHLLAPGLAEEGLPPFPFISLLVSGGHTLLLRVDGIGQYRLIGQTLDDAAGECFDKTARLLDLPYPGGPQIARLAEGGDGKRFKLPRPMLDRDNLNFSFSGLKTAVMQQVRGRSEPLDEQSRRDLAAAIEAAVADVLVGKSLAACRQEGIRHLVLAGGVAANRKLRAQLHAGAAKSGIELRFPALHHCTDNGAMIALVGLLRSEEAAGDWDARPRWDLSELSSIVTA